MQELVMKHKFIDIYIYIFNEWFNIERWLTIIILFNMLQIKRDIFIVCEMHWLAFEREENQQIKSKWTVFFIYQRISGTHAFCFFFFSFLFCVLCASTARRKISCYKIELFHVSKLSFCSKKKKHSQLIVLFVWLALVYNIYIFSSYFHTISYIASVLKNDKILIIEFPVLKDSRKKSIESLHATLCMCWCEYQKS